MLYGLQDGVLGDFVEHDAFRGAGVQSEHFTQVPADGFSLAVLIGSQPYGGGLLCLLLQFGYHFCLVGWYLVLWFEGLLVNAETLLLEVADVPVTGHHAVVLSQKLFNRFGLCGALYNHQILFHVVSFFDFRLQR